MEKQSEYCGSAGGWCRTAYEEWRIAKTVFKINGEANCDLHIRKV